VRGEAHAQKESRINRDFHFSTRYGRYRIPDALCLCTISDASNRIPDNSFLNLPSGRYISTPIIGFYFRISKLQVENGGRALNLKEGLLTFPLLAYIPRLRDLQKKDYGSVLVNDKESN
jgi:hypothetical protein